MEKFSLYAVKHAWRVKLSGPGRNPCSAEIHDEQLTLLSAVYSPHHSPFAHVVNQCIIIPVVCFLSDRSRNADQVLVFDFGDIPAAFIFQFIF